LVIFFTVVRLSGFDLSAFSVDDRHIADFEITALIALAKVSV